MAYGQTGTGKTYTLGRLGDEDTSARGIMVRSMEDIFSSITVETDSIMVSYLQVAMQSLDSCAFLVNFLCYPVSSMHKLIQVYIH